MVQTVEGFNNCLFLVITLLYFYQIVYLAVSLFAGNKKKTKPAKKLHKFAAVIAARNESKVIGELIRGLNNQNYPKELLDVFVIADNCTDNTAEVARELGAIVYERENKEKVGKSYALDRVFKNILRDYEDAGYEGFFIFDADNLIDENFVREMNKLYDQGYRVATSYRNSKNYGTNWITAGYSLWFLREAKFLNQPRMQLNTNCAVSGTGFLIAADIIRKNNGWKYHLLTEDIEFSVDCAIQGEKIGYSKDAVIYDEQPTTFRQSWTQRLRWSKGFYQVARKYSGALLKGIFKGKRPGSCYDMLMTVAPGTFLTFFCILVNLLFLICSFSEPMFVVRRMTNMALHAVLFSLVNVYLSFFIFGLFTTITEWKKIKAPAVKKILYLFTFPIFMFTYVPIAVVALVRKVRWEPIKHEVVKTVDEIR